MSNPYFLTWQETLDNLLSYLPAAWRANFSGKVLKRLLVAFALTIEGLYALLARLLRLAIPATSEGGWLRAIVAGWGMSTYGGISAQVSVRFTRYVTTDSINIALGVQVGAVNGQIFETAINAVIPAGQSFVDVPCVAVEPGIAGNIRSGEIVGLITPVTGVDAVSNPNPGFAGEDAESDAAIKARIPQYLESLHRGTIPATEFAIAINRELFPEVRSFLTQRNFGNPGYFRGILSDYSGGDLYRAKGWVQIGDTGTYFIATALTEINGLVSAGFPCQRFGIPIRQPDGEEIWQASLFVTEVQQGNWRFCHDVNLGRLYARADGRDLNTLEITIYADVVWRALRHLELNWAANGVFLDILVPFTVQGDVSIVYALEPGYDSTEVENGLRTAISDYVKSLVIGQDFDLEGLYTALSLVAGAGGVTVSLPLANVSVPEDSVFRLASLPQVTRLAA